MMLRDLRRRAGCTLLRLAMVIAVASLTSVGFLADRVGRALDREANQLPVATCCCAPTDKLLA